MEKKETSIDKDDGYGKVSAAVAISALTAVIYFFSNPNPQRFYDYTYRVAGNLLQGAIGFTEKPPSWLNEFVPLDGFYYSVFPFGAVISMIPVALLKSVGLINDMPGGLVAAVQAGIVCYFLLRIASRYDISRSRQILMSLGIVFGTFMWTNLTFGSAWQLALGFAMVGELGAIYFTVYDRRPVIAGIFFAMAFGNRTENLLTAPILMFLLVRDNFVSKSVAQPSGGASEAGLTSENDVPETEFAQTHESQKSESNDPQAAEISSISPATEKSVVTTDNLVLDNTGTSVSPSLRDDETLPATRPESSNNFAFSALRLRRLAAFCAVPFVLGISTLIYNYVRFNSFTDFGYDRIPGVLEEPWYNHGIFSTQYIWRQAEEMLWKWWTYKDTFPYLFPNPFSSSIIMSSPFLLLVLWPGWRDRWLKYASWASVIVLTFLLWMHGNSGGWQFGYRYAIVLLPWVFVILLESARKRFAIIDWVFFIVSFAANIYATWLFHWTKYI